MTATDTIPDVERDSQYVTESRATPGTSRQSKINEDYYLYIKKNFLYNIIQYLPTKTKQKIRRHGRKSARVAADASAPTAATAKSRTRPSASRSAGRGRVARLLRRLPLARPSRTHAARTINKAPGTRPVRSDAMTPRRS